MKSVTHKILRGGRFDVSSSNIVPTADYTMSPTSDYIVYDDTGFRCARTH